MAQRKEVQDGFVRIDLDLPRKIRFRHKDLRDVCKNTGKSIGDLFSDPFVGWPNLLLYGLRWQDLKLSEDKCSEFMDEWVSQHSDEQYPLQSLGEKLLAALNASGFVKIEAEGKLDDGGLEGNSPIDDSIP